MPRRRVPLRPRLGARARALRRRPALVVLRRDPPGPGAVAGEADRGAVGRRARRLPGRELPGPLGRVEREVPRLPPGTSGAARRQPGRVRLALHRLEPETTSTRTTGRRPGRRRSTSSPATMGLHTLADLVSYERKHNEANLDGDGGGTDDNRSWNCGVEGPTRRDPAVLEPLRARQQRNFLATLLLSQGVPMLLGGDESGRTQLGNNNAWCQDNELSWVDWSLDEPGGAHALVLPAPDRAPAQSPGLPAGELPHGHGGQRLRAPRRLVVPAGRPADADPGLVERHGARRVPERRRDPRPRARRRPRRRRLVPRQAPERGRGEHRLPAARPHGTAAGGSSS